MEAQTIAGETVEYGYSTSSNGKITWQDGTAFTGLTPVTEYFFFARVKESGTHKAGTTSTGTAITTKTAPTTISGKVTDSDGTNLSGATVTLTPSEPVITATTAADGTYTFNNVPTGIYNLVVTKGSAPNEVTITEKITVAGTPIADKNMQFLSGDKNTVVEITPGSPEISVGGMNDLLDDTNIGTTLKPAEKAAVDAGGSVLITVKADEKTGSEVADDKSKIEAIATGKKIDMLLDLSVLKTVKDSSDVTITDGEKLTTLAALIEITVKIPSALQGKTGLTLYRVHNGAAQVMPTSPDGNGEYYEISADGTYMTLHVKNFSIYALGYTAFSVTLSGGGSGSSGAGSYDAGDTVNINAGTRSGYSFNGWSTESANVIFANASNASTSFVMPNGAVTVTASWTHNGGGNDTGGSGSSSDNSEYDFWMSVKDKIQKADAGDVVKVSASSYDKMPWSVMDALRKNDGVSLVITWNGETITIPASKASNNEPGRIYWPLSLLAQIYANITVDTVLQQELQNPETGGPAKYIPVTGGGELITLEAPNPVADNAQAVAPIQPKAITPPDGGFEADAFAGTPDAKNAESRNGVLIMTITVMLATLCGIGLWFWKKKKEEA